MTVLSYPPGAPGQPVEAEGSDLEAFDRDPLAFLTSCAREFGPVARVDFGRPFFLLNRADLVEAALQDKGSILTKTMDATDQSRWIDPQSLKYTAFRSLLGQGLLTTDGEDWRRRRRILAPPFQPKATAGYQPTIASLVERLTDAWNGCDRVDVYEEMRELTLGVVGMTLMGSDLSDRAKDEGRDFKAALEHFYRPSVDASSASVPFGEALARLHRSAGAIVSARRESGGRGDLLSRLLRDEGDAGSLSAEDLRNELMTLLFAGHETTANALCWTWVLLAQNPEKERRLALELESVLGDGPLAEADLESLPYTRMVVSESLRLWPPVWFLGRFLQSEWRLEEYTFPAGSGLIVSPWVMQRDGAHFAGPETFEPERWAGDLEHRLPRGIYFPFGDGPRVCIGRPLALLELALVVAAVARRYQLSLTPGQEVTWEALNTIRPRGGLVMQLRRW